MDKEGSIPSQRPTDESVAMPIEKDKYYTVGEIIDLTMEEMGISREEAAQMIWDGMNSGELPFENQPVTNCNRLNDNSPNNLGGSDA